MVSHTAAHHSVHALFGGGSVKILSGWPQPGPSNVFTVELRKLKPRAGGVGITF